MDRNYYYLFFSLSSEFFPSLNEMPMLQSTTLLVSLWLCHQCSHLNDSNRNRKRYSLCKAWRDGLAPLSAKGGTSMSGAASSDIGFVDDDATCHDENGAPNNVSPHKGGSPTKRGIKKKSPSCGLDGVLCMSTLPLPPPLLHPMRQITTSLLLECIGISNGVS